MKKLYSLLLLLVLSASGCTSLNNSTREWDSDAAKWMIPVNATAAYFASVSLHEFGHAGSALALGAERVTVDVLPARDSNGVLYLGLTTATFENEFSETERTIFTTMGPTAQFTGHIGSRLLLRSGMIPRIAQPTVAWFQLFNQIGFYYHVLNGLARNDRTDLGKSETWISVVMLAGLTFDIIDFFTEDKPENRFLVLFGDHYYEDTPDETARLQLMTAPQPGGGFLGLRFNF